MGTLAAIAAVCLLVATGMMEIEEDGYWELLYATNLVEGDTFGRSNPKYVGVDSCWELDCFVQRKRVVFRKVWYRKNRQGGDRRASPVAPPVWALYQRM